MEIKIKRRGSPVVNGDPGALDVTNMYRVTAGEREFYITFRSHPYGASLGIAGEEGVLYTDSAESCVRRQVLVPGRDCCGINVEKDESVEGLSPWAIRGVILAGKRGEAREITLIIEEDGAGVDSPMVLVDGAATDWTL